MLNLDVLSGIKRVLLWDYARATWQYDVMVLAIVVFVFFTPRTFFRDRPRVPYSSQVAVLPASDGRNMFWINPELMNELPGNLSEARRLQKISDRLSERTGKKQVITHIEPIFDSEQEIKGYMAVASR